MANSITLKNISKQVFMWKTMNFLPATEITNISPEEWDQWKKTATYSQAVKQNQILVIESDEAPIAPEIDVAVPTPAVGQSRVGDENVKLTIGVEGEETRDISKIEAPVSESSNVDWNLVSGMTKGQIEDYADKFQVQLNLEDTKNEMIAKFKEAVSA